MHDWKSFVIVPYGGCTTAHLIGNTENWLHMDNSLGRLLWAADADAVAVAIVDVDDDADLDLVHLS
jgi:hypothetical protein